MDTTSVRSLRLFEQPFNNGRLSEIELGTVAQIPLGDTEPAPRTGTCQHPSSRKDFNKSSAPKSVRHFRPELGAETPR